MIVGVLRVDLRLGGTRSLKDKRRIIQSLLDRVHRQSRMAAAEVDAQESWRRSTLAFACVSGETQHATRMLSRVVGLIEREAQVDLVDYTIEIL